MGKKEVIPIPSAAALVLLKDERESLSFRWFQALLDMAADISTRQQLTEYRGWILTSFEEGWKQAVTTLQEKGMLQADGTDGLRDSSSICEEYKRGISTRGGCEGDGHYLCESCIWWAR